MLKTPAYPRKFRIFASEETQQSISQKQIVMGKLNIYEEASRCLLCQDAPCTKACTTGDPARAIRAIRFDLGLPICKAIVKLLGGKIWLDTEYHEGSRFVFSIPKGGEVTNLS